MPTTIVSPRSIATLPAGSISVERLISLLLLSLLLLFFSTNGARTFDERLNSRASEAQGAIANTQTDSDVASGQAVTAAWVSATIVILILSWNGVLAAARQMRFLTVLAILPALSSLWSAVPLESLRRGALFLLSSLLGYHFASAYSHTKQIRTVINVGAVAAATSCIAAILFPHLGQDHMTHDGAWRGIYSHKNLCAFAMILFISPLFGRERRRVSPTDMAYASLVLFVLAMTQSRTGWIVCTAYLAAMCALKCLGRFTARDSRILAITMLMLIAGAVWLLFQNAESVLGSVGRDLTFSGRTDIWRAVLEAIFRRPLLGYGYAAFWKGLQGESASVIMAVGWAVPHAHNAFLEVWLQLGLLGMSCLLITLVMAMRDFAVCFTPKRSRAVDWYIGLLIIIVMYGLAEPFLLVERSLAWVLYITACVGLRRCAVATRRTKQSHAINPPAEQYAE